MIITVQIDVGAKSKEAWESVNQALADFDIVSMSWGEPAPPPQPVKKASTKPEDLGTGLSQTIDRLTGGR